MRPDGSRVRVLNASRVGECAEWSPDGRRIAFSSERDGEGEVWVMDADGSHQRRLTHDPATYDAPKRWLP
jgi:TolB protein